MAHTDSFYDQLPVVDHFADLSNSDVYTALPDDWSVAVSDVKNSTGMIRAGKYRHVNLIGAAALMALLNLKKSFSLPFIFGGDGAVVCIPPTLVAASRAALLATRAMAQDLYGIELRIGIVPVSAIRTQGLDVRVARSRLSSSYTQAAFSGGGLQWAEDCLKDTIGAARFAVEGGDGTAQADFTGLECRWQNVPSAHEEIVSLIVQALGSTPDQRGAVYRQVLTAIGAIYGDDAQCHPVQQEQLNMSLRERDLMGEANIRSYAGGSIYRLWYGLKLRWLVLVGKALMALNWRTRHTVWGTYKQRLVEHTDFKKFDDKLRQVLSGSVKQREQLENCLVQLRRERKLVYGIHAASHALITCLLFNHSDAHVHLVDADGGGYAVAAAMLKQQCNDLDGNDVQRQLTHPER